MSDKFVAIDVQGLEELGRKMARFSPEVQDAITQKVAEYLVKVLQTDQPTPNHNITRKQAYGVTFFTKKQRNYFFYALHAGIIHVPYTRTQATRRGWHILGHGRNAMVVNETVGAYYTRDDDRQARLNSLVGWKKLKDVIRERHEEIERQAVIGAKEGIKKAGLS